MKLSVLTTPSLHLDDCSRATFDQVWRMYQKAGAKAGIGGLGTHSLRHMYRSWLDAVGTPVAVQQKLMRHADIRTTMNIYGDIVTDALIMMIQRSNFKRDDSPVRLAFQKAALE